MSEPTPAPGDLAPALTFTADATVTPAAPTTAPDGQAPAAAPRED